MGQNRDLNLDQNRKFFRRFFLTYCISILLLGAFVYLWANQPCKEEQVLREQLEEVKLNQANIEELNKKMESIQKVLNDTKLSPAEISEKTHALMVEIENTAKEKELSYGAYHILISKYIEAKRTSLQVVEMKKEIKKIDREKRAFEAEEKGLKQRIRICCQ